MLDCWVECQQFGWLHTVIIFFTVYYLMAMSTMSTEGIFKDRTDRTVKLHFHPEGRPYGRREVLDGLLSSGVERESIEALGVRERTLKSIAARKHLLQLSGIQVKGKEATANGLRKGSQRLRVFYLPFYVPVEVVVQQLIRADMKVLKTFQDRDRETGLMSNVWIVIVEVDVPDNVPDRMRWSFGCMTGSVLVNMAGRPPKCLRCSVRGHRKFECTASPGVVQLAPTRRLLAVMAQRIRRKWTITSRRPPSNSRRPARDPGPFKWTRPT